jgi:hypothetical protein
MERYVKVLGHEGTKLGAQIKIIFDSSSSALERGDSGDGFHQERCEAYRVAARARERTVNGE